MIRAQFLTGEDWRPVKWPPPGPCWMTGEAAGYSSVLAYVEELSQIKEFWPDATDIDSDAVECIVFNGRFPKPAWWYDERVCWFVIP